jgi:phage terminase small subunit
MASSGEDRELTAKQEAFVEEYLVDRNATQAAIRAGYSQKTAADIGRQLLRKTPVREAIDARQAQISKKLRIDAEWVERQLVRNHREAHKGQPIVNNEGEVVGYRKDLAASNKALELLGRRTGGFVEQKQLNVNVSFEDLVISSVNGGDE